MISVIVPVFNGETFLPRCVPTLLAQTHSDLEIILVNDGSTDGSAAVCDTYAEQDHRVHVIHQQNRGLSSARNVGMAFATGDWIGFVDCDDWIAPDFFARLWRAAQKTGVDVVYGGIVRVQGKAVPTLPAPTPVRVLSREDFFTGFFRLGTQECVFYVWNGLYRRTLVAPIFFREAIRHGEDVDFTFRVALSACSIACEEGARYFYYQNPNGITGRRFSRADFDLIDVWDYIVFLCRKTSPELLPYAELNRNRTDFTLLTRLFLDGTKEMDVLLQREADQLLCRLRANYPSLLSAQIPLSRKALILLLVKQDRLAKRLLRAAGNAKRRRTKQT